MNVRADPERDQVRVYERRGAATWDVALLIGEITLEQGGAVEAERLAQAWRARLGMVGPEWVRREEAARQLGVGVKMVDKLRRSGRLRGLRVPHTNRAYVHRDDLSALIRARRGARP